MNLKSIELKFKEVESFVKSELSVFSKNKIENSKKKASAFLDELLNKITYIEVPDTDNLRTRIPYFIGDLYLFCERHNISLDEDYKELIPKDSVYFSEKEKSSYSHKNTLPLKKRFPKRGELIETKLACQMAGLSYSYFTVLIRRLNLEEKLGFKQKHGYVKFDKRAFNILKKVKKKNQF